MAHFLLQLDGFLGKGYTLCQIGSLVDTIIHLMHLVLNRWHQFKISLINILGGRTLYYRLYHTHVTLCRETGKIYIVGHRLILYIDSCWEYFLIVRLSCTRLVHINNHLILLRLVNHSLERELTIFDCNAIQIGNTFQSILLQHDRTAVHVTFNLTFHHKILRTGSHCKYKTGKCHHASFHFHLIHFFSILFII